MKKILCLVLALVLVFSLCACGEPQVITETVEVEKEVIKEVVPEKYEELFSALEAEDYDGAAALINAMRPEPEIEAIEITMDNFFDYFEPYEYANYENATRDAQGNILELTVFYGYALKPEFTLAEDADTERSVKAGLEWTESAYYSPKYGGLEINFDTLEFKNSVRPFDVQHKSELLDFYPHPSLDTSYACYVFSHFESRYSNNDSVSLVTDLNVVSASGTLYLAK